MTVYSTLDFFGKQALLFEKTSFALDEVASFALDEVASFALDEVASFALDEVASFALDEVASFAYLTCKGLAFTMTTDCSPRTTDEFPI